VEQTSFWGHDPNRQGRGPKTPPTPATTLHTTCSKKWRRRRHAQELAPPLLSAAATCLCLVSHNEDARPFPLALLYSPHTHLLLPHALARRCLSRPRWPMSLCSYHHWPSCSSPIFALALQHRAFAMSRPNPGDPERSLPSSAPVMRKKKGRVRIGKNSGF